MYNCPSPPPPQKNATTPKHLFQCAILVSLWNCCYCLAYHNDIQKKCYHWSHMNLYQNTSMTSHACGRVSQVDLVEVCVVMCPRELSLQHLASETRSRNERIEKVCSICSYVNSRPSPPTPAPPHPQPRGRVVESLWLALFGTKHGIRKQNVVQRDWPRQ